MKPVFIELPRIKFSGLQPFETVTDKAFFNIHSIDGIVPAESELEAILYVRASQFRIALPPDDIKVRIDDLTSTL